jgi:hypothetical protein
VTQKTINDPLSCAEIKRIILDQISAKLDANSCLHDDMAYAGFDVSYTLNIGFLRATVPTTLVWGLHQEGEPIEGSESLEVASVVGDFDTDSPNTARVEHDLPVPVEVKTPSGVEKRHVRLPNPKKQA